MRNELAIIVRAVYRFSAAETLQESHLPSTHECEADCFLTSNYSNNKVVYNPLRSNFNSFINWLLQSGYVSQYFNAPPETVGWSTSFYGTAGGVFPD